MSEDIKPTDAHFFDAGLDIHALDDLNFESRPTVLDRLGPAHFRSKGFSFMGFLQTVYDHVAEQAKSPTLPPVTATSEVAEATESAEPAEQPAEQPAEPAV